MMNSARALLATLALMLGASVCLSSAAGGYEVSYSFSSGTNPGLEIEHVSGTFNTASMQADEAKKLCGLIEKSGVLTASDKDFEMLDGGANYHLKIASGIIKRQFDWSPRHAPKSIDKLVSYLEEHSKKEVIPPRHLSLR